MKPASIVVALFLFFVHTKVSAQVYNPIGNLLPKFNVNDDIHFYLYTRNTNVSSPNELTVDNVTSLAYSTFNPELPTIVIVHGWISSKDFEQTTVLRDAYLAAEDVNVIAVDWQPLATPSYTAAMRYQKPVGTRTGQLVELLVANGAQIETFHLIGFSLGAHVVAFTNNYLNNTIPRITGLDPARPLIEGQPADTHLDPTDAQVVDVIHTSAGMLGYLKQTGTHDFYPNKGADPQPGCAPLRFCSHLRAYQLYASTLTHNFSAISCESDEQALAGTCNGTTTALMGILAYLSPPGVYFLTTTATPPYI